ncbi:C-GCAxxG-C-C family (seleno)protein [Bacteroidota bacterium]
MEERASDPLAGGIYQQGYQCGMLWGASFASGAEAFRRDGNTGKGIGAAVKATKHIMESFTKRAKSIECYDITDCDWSSKISMAKYFFSGKFLSCFTLAEEWVPEAIESAHEGLSLNQDDSPAECISSASEAAKKMGANDEEMMMVAGFAGGLGLSGNACGALAAAIWMKNLEKCRKSEKTTYRDPDSEETLKTFYEASDYKMLCSEITDKRFNTIDEHTNFIKNGGCAKLIDELAQI